VIDAWIEWDDGHPGLEAVGHRAKQFIVEFCRARNIADEFYRRFASWEFAG
jgi:hypothetical protein